MHLLYMRILLTSTQSPGNGGAATNVYKLHKYFLNNYKEKDIKVYCVFFLCNKEDLNNITINPDDLENVSYIRCFWKDGRLLDYDKGTNKYIEYTEEYKEKFKQNIIDSLGGEPDIVLAKNYRAPVTSKILFSKSKIYYLVSGVYYLSILNNYLDEKISGQTILNKFEYYNNILYLLKNKNIPSFSNIKQETETIKLVDGVIFNSKLTTKLMKLYYKDIIKDYKIINTSLLKRINNKCDDFNTRKYDIIFVCSNFNRKIKNCKFVKDLFLKEELSKYNKIVIGDGDLFEDKEIKNITILKQQSNKVVLEKMKESKLLLLPSLFDSSPNTIYEALDSGCNIVTSKNTGNWELFNSKSVCNDIYNKDEWINKILINVEEKVINNIEFENTIISLI